MMFMVGWSNSRLRNDQLCVEWDVKPYTLTHSLDSPMIWTP